jgi:Tfp pilus assembly protein PilN
MLRTNLSTRPFYNERLVTAAVALAALLIVVLTAFNVVQLTTLSRRNATLGATVNRAETEAEKLRQQAAQARGQVDRERLEAVLKASEEANRLIDRRVFSWTGLLNQLEATLPPDVRIQAIRPSDDDGVLRLTMNVFARRIEDVETFITRLEGTGAFRDVVPLSDSTTNEGLLEVELEGRYVVSGAAAARPTETAR